MTSEQRPFLQLADELSRRSVPFVLIGVAGADYWARSAGTVLATQDRDLYLPLDADVLHSAWQSALHCGFELWAGTEPLSVPHDRALAGRVVESQATTTAVHPEIEGTEVDFTLSMAGFDFATVHAEHRPFRVGGTMVPVARLSHIVQSKARANRPKDRLFLATYEDALRRLLREEED